MEVEEIVKMKLETIKEESDEEKGPGPTTTSKVRKANKIFSSRWSIKDSYVLIMNGFASKGLSR